MIEAVSDFRIVKNAIKHIITKTQSLTICRYRLNHDISDVNRSLEEYWGGDGGLHCPKSVGGNSFHFWTICTCKIKKVVVFKNVVREYFVQNFFEEYAYFSLRMMSFFQKSVVEVEVMVCVGGGCCKNVFFNF